jgi:hypothetical protein
MSAKWNFFSSNMKGTYSYWLRGDKIIQSSQGLMGPLFASDLVRPL